MGKSPRKRQVPQKVPDLSDSVSKDENTNIFEIVKRRNKRETPSRSKPIESKTDESSPSFDDSDEGSSDDSIDHTEEKKGPSKNLRTSNKSTIEKSKYVESSFSEDEESISKNDAENRKNKKISGNSKVKKTKGSKEESQDDEAKSKSPDNDVEFSDQDEESSGGLPDIQSLCETLEKESVQDNSTSVEESQRNPRIVIAIKSKPAPKKRKNDELDGEKKGKRGRKAKSVQEIKKPKNVRKDSAATEKTDEESETDANDDSSEKDSGKGKQNVKRKFPCHKCNAEFNRTYELFDHTCEGKRLRGFACEFCDKIYLKRSIYINHKIIHSRKKPYKCGLCQKKSSSQSNHLYHMKKFHPEAKLFPCEFPPCTKSFMTRKEQMEHHKTHTKFICCYCDEAFNKNSTMLSHKRKEHDVYF
ncbi:uncharacterized protein TNCT_372141 [Trichonephila clavata]|uniref:C2H2-type domain-containing protein n=1 Tax=Trichonephila clavata TaxID=2740835 RepID=A0A8X6M2G2_TRICU|nr:uncharacterized protein TNCT_372141 [Trichonephila clavata]